MLESSERGAVMALLRVGLWFASVLISVALFSLLLGRLLGPASRIDQCFLGIVRLALPAACLYLPFVLALSGRRKWHFTISFVSGVLIGPVSLVFWGFYAWFHDGYRFSASAGNRFFPGIEIVFGFYALIAGTLTTILYLQFLAATLRRLGASVL